MKPLTLDQQIQVARVLGWISGVIEGSAKRAGIWPSEEP